MNQNILTVGAILIGFAMIAGVVVYKDTTITNGIQASRTDGGWIYGSPKAPVTIVEFSDIECPFCARLHPTLERIVDESEGGVNWEYRHLPLPMHRNAELGAMASECVGRLTDTKTFWKYLSVLLDNQGTHSVEFYQTQATQFGVSVAEYQACITDSEVAAVIANDQKTAAAFGGRGTPFSIIVSADGSVKPVSGALPYEQWKALVQ